MTRGNSAVIGARRKKAAQRAVDRLSHRDFPMMAPLVTPAVKGVATIDHFTLTKEQADFANMRSSFQPGGHLMHVNPGTYARLQVEGQLMMTDTDMERRSNSDVLYRANGDVLIAGLGLGMILQTILRKPDVRSVLVIEKYQDVIDLVMPSLAVHLPRLSVVCADIFEWTPPKGQLWDVIYFDIWPTIDEDNLKQMATLSRKFSRRLNRSNPRFWMESWQQRHLQAKRDSERRSSWSW